MDKLNYLLLPFISVLLVTAQASWGHFIKSTRPFQGSLWQIIINFITTPLFWFGAMLYGCATVAYFLSLSKFQFFTVQITVTATAVVFSALLSSLFFRETLTIVNFVGVVLAVSGIYLALVR